MESILLYQSRAAGNNNYAYAYDIRGFSYFNLIHYIRVWLEWKLFTLIAKLPHLTVNISAARFSQNTINVSKSHRTSCHKNERAFHQTYPKRVFSCSGGTIYALHGWCGCKKKLAGTKTDFEACGSGSRLSWKAAIFGWCRLFW